MKTLLIVLSIALGFPLLAQDIQNRTGLHVMADINDHWFIPVWSISNFRTQSPNNTNVFAGLGYRGGKEVVSLISPTILYDPKSWWWVEGLVQKQWNRSGGLWSVDARYRRQFNRVSVYVEPSLIFTPKTAFYEFVIVEERVWKGLSLRQETENVHRPGKDTIAVGGGIGYLFPRWRGCDIAAAVVYRASPTGRDEPRAYLNITHRIRLHR
jgi:hypothetical protein